MPVKIDPITEEEIIAFSEWILDLIKRSEVINVNDRYTFCNYLGIHTRTLDNWVSPTSVHKPRYGATYKALKRLEQLIRVREIKREREQQEQNGNSNEHK